MTRRTILVLGGLAIADLLVSLWIGQQAYHWMPPQASAESILVDNLFSFMTTLGSFIFLGVMGTLLYAILFQRAAKYDASDGPPIEGNVKLEVVWTAIPILLVIWIATFSYQTYDRMAILGSIEPRAMGMPTAEAAAFETTALAQSPDTPSAAVPPPIHVYARQWAWEFHYPDPDIRSTELHLPVNQRARLMLSSEDVLHGFFIPAFRVKQDVVPGREIGFEFTPIRAGRYRLRDSEYSGTYFAANQTNVVVESAADYQRWLTTAAAMPPFPAENVAYEEFNRATQNSTGPSWETVKPAPAPVVNYASAEEDPHE
ncbi:MAG: cytochrome c oxidase subunit II [Cyanobacteria bacterium P01_F01_bin.4]